MINTNTRVEVDAGTREVRIRRGEAEGAILGKVDPTFLPPGYFAPDSYAEDQAAGFPKFFAAVDAWLAERRIIRVGDLHWTRQRYLYSAEVVEEGAPASAAG